MNLKNKREYVFEFENIVYQPFLDNTTSITSLRLYPEVEYNFIPVTYFNSLCSVALYDHYSNLFTIYLYVGSASTTGHLIRFHYQCQLYRW